MNISKLKTNILIIMLFLLMLSSNAGARAAGIGSPLPGSPSVNSWFDHNNPGSGNNSLMIRYDDARWTNTSSCQLGVSCYDGHNGIDFQASINTDVIAAEAGTITTYWESIGGNVARISHPTLGYSTLYAHLDSYLVTSGTVSRGQVIAKSGCTGTGCGGPHLHFAVYNTTNSSGGNPIDPYGWTGTGTDPYVNDIGILWGSSNCTPPGSGDWIITSPNNCTITNLQNFSGNIEVQNGAILTVESNGNLNMDFINKKILVKNGGKIFIRNGGKIN